MVTFWLLIDTIAMIGSPASRGATASVLCSGRAWRGAASAGRAAVSAVRAAVAASVTIAGGAHRRTTSVDWAVVHRFAMPCPGCQGGIRVETNTENGWMVPVLRPVVNQRFRVIGLLPTDYLCAPLRTWSLSPRVRAAACNGHLGDALPPTTLHVFQTARPSCGAAAYVAHDGEPGGSDREHDAVAKVLIIGASRGIGLETVKAAL